MNLDITTAYKNYAFLGSEFLTFLWYLTDTNQDLNKCVSTDNQVEITLGDSIMIENTSVAEKPKEKITIKGEDAGLEEALLALKKGGSITQMNILCKIGEMDCNYTLKSADLALTSLKAKLVASNPRDSEELAGYLFERIYINETVTEVVNDLFKHFIKTRIADDWETETLPAIRKWIASEA